MKKLTLLIFMLIIGASFCFGDIYLKIKGEKELVNLNKRKDVHYVRVKWEFKVIGKGLTPYLRCGIGKKRDIKDVYNKAGKKLTFIDGSGLLNHFFFNGWKITCYCSQFDYFILEKKSNT